MLLGKGRLNLRLSKAHSLCIATIIILLGVSSLKADINYDLNISARNVVQGLQDNNTGERQDLNSLIIAPSLSLVYQGKSVNGFWRASHQHVRRTFENQGQDQDQDQKQTENYTDYNYGTSIEVIDNLLLVSSQGAVTYRSPSIDGFLVDDILLNSQNLSKTRTNRANAQFTLPRGDYFGLISNMSLSSTESEANESSAIAFDSQQYAISTVLRSGNSIKRLNAQISSEVSLTKRRASQGDYLSRVSAAELSYNLVSKLAITLAATNEGNQVSGGNSNLSRARNFNTYGAGLTWRSAENKFMTVSYNASNGDTLDEDNEAADGTDEDDNNSFIGLNVNWAFTERTLVTANYRRRFFGESGAFSFAHRIKRFRTQVSYTEEVTSFSNLLAEPSSLGVFVCQDGARDLSACFQPSSINYQLAPNEEFVQFAQTNSEINDELILRKALSWQLGVSQRRTNLSINGRYSTNEYLESTRLNRTYGAGIVFGFSLGQKTAITWNANYAVTDNRLEDLSTESTVLTSSLSISRTFGRRINASLDFSYTDRETENLLDSDLSADNFQNDLVNRRISLNLSYNYDGK